MEKFIQYIQDIHPLPQDDLQLLLNEGDELYLPKGHHLVDEGEINRSIYLLKEGVIRGFHYYEERETTVWFVLPGEAAFSSWGYVSGKPSQLTIEASCESTVLHYTKDRLEQLFSTSFALSTWGRKMFERVVLTTDQWAVDFWQPLASDRYLSLAEKLPEILQNVQLKDIAGFLGMTPQSLSRIRAELGKKGK